MTFGGWNCLDEVGVEGKVEEEYCCLRHRQLCKAPTPGSQSSNNIHTLVLSE